MRLHEQPLAEELQVSRIPLREVIPQLEVDGLVVSTPRRGTVVASWTTAKVHEIFDARLALELAAVRRACQVVSEGGALEGLRDAERTTRAGDGDGDQYARAVSTTRFHLAVVESSGNALLTQLMRAVGWRMTWLFYLTRNRDPGVQEDEHRACVAAMRAGDARLAEALMTAHIESGRQPSLRMMRSLLERPPAHRAPGAEEKRRRDGPVVAGHGR